MDQRVEGKMTPELTKRMYELADKYCIGKSGSHICFINGFTAAVEEMEKINQGAREFPEKDFKNQWVIRGIGMPLPLGAVQGARCYHEWFVKKQEVKE